MTCTHTQYSHSSDQRGHKSRVVGGTVIVHRDGMLRCCFSRLQRQNNIPRSLCVSRLFSYSVRFVHTVLASIPQSLMTSVARSPKRWVFNSPYPLVQFLESESSVVSSQPRTLRGAIPMYTLPVLSASSTSARPREGYWATLVVLDLVLSYLSLARFPSRTLRVNSRARSRSTWTRSSLARGGASYFGWCEIKSKSRGSSKRAICIG